ncbi:MAG TPA: hypothetical protein VI541_05110 [Actinomycetota bacterium]|nr:hypothetical protein [Actinomycetota bacterium]
MKMRTKILPLVLIATFVLGSTAVARADDETSRGAGPSPERCAAKLAKLESSFEKQTAKLQAQFDRKKAKLAEQLAKHTDDPEAQARFERKQARLQAWFDKKSGKLNARHDRKKAKLGSKCGAPATA